MLATFCRANATVLLSDNFDSNSFDLSKWATNYTSWDAPYSQIIATNQRVEFTDRGYLTTVTNYDPAASGGLLITGTWTILQSGGTGYGEAPVVITRSSGVPSGVSGNVSDGVLFVLQPPENGFQPLIVGQGGAAVTGYNQISNTLSLVQGDTVNFTITDDGTNLTFNVAKAGNPALAGTATAVCTSHLATNKITFYNRELGGDSSALDNVVIQTVQAIQPPVPFTYTTNNGAITIVGYTGTGGMVVIPATINGYPVTSIGNQAFYFCTNLTSVTIPNSVSSIGSEAFLACTNLAGLTIGNGVTNIADYAFENCYSLTNVVIPNSVTSIGDDVFINCTSLTSVSIPNSLSSIGVSMFNYCRSLSNVTIPTSINSIGAYAFSYCTSLTNVMIPNSVTSIGADAFFNCSSLAGVILPNGITTIAQGTFGQCYSLQSITIPAGVTSIGGYAFGRCLNLLKVTIPDSVTTITGNAFMASGLCSITIGSSVVSIGGAAFSDCANLTNVYFLGNSPTPTNDTTVFGFDGNAIAYYLPDTPGWGATFDGIPTQILLPPPPALGISTYSSQPAVFFPTATGTNYVLQMSTNLASGNWVTVSNGIPINGLIITNPPTTAFFRLH